jgi:hypothetical protein
MEAKPGGNSVAADDGDDPCCTIKRLIATVKVTRHQGAKPPIGEIKFEAMRPRRYFGLESPNNAELS